MAGTMTVKCYIESYKGDEGRIGLQLREKSTGRKVTFGDASPSDGDALMQFLVAGFSNVELMPEIVDKNGDMDAVEVSGNVQSDVPGELRFWYDAQLQYLFV